MKCHFNKMFANTVSTGNNALTGYSLVETMAALAILVIFTTGIFIVINRCVTSAADTTLQMQALTVARENMEKLLTSSSAQEKVEYGTSERYPEIQWKVTVETFAEPVKSEVWVRAISSAEYPGIDGNTQSIELTHWLVKLGKEEAAKIKERDVALEQLALASGKSVEELKSEMQDGTPPEPTKENPTEPAQNDSGKTQEPSGTDTSTEPKPPPKNNDLGLPDNWNSMSRDDQIRWLFQDLIRSRSNNQ